MPSSLDERIERKVGLVQPGDQGCRGEEGQGRTVGRSLLDQLARHRARIARLVLDDDMATQATLELGRDQPGDDVGAAVGLEADKDPQTPFGQDGLCPSGWGEERRRGAGGTAEEGAT